MVEKSIFIKFDNSSILVYLLGIDEIIDKLEIPKCKLQETLVELFFEFLSNNNCHLRDVSKLYFEDSWASWNANRLLTLFIKTISFYENLSIYYFNIQNISNNNNISFDFKYFLSIKDNFLKIDNPLELKPNYNTCKITNT